MEPEVLRVRVCDDSAVLTALGTNHGTYQGQPFTADEWITDVFIRRRCVLTHLTPAG